MTALLFRPSSELYIHYTERLELGKWQNDVHMPDEGGGATVIIFGYGTMGVWVLIKEITIFVDLLGLDLLKSLIFKKDRWESIVRKNVRGNFHEDMAGR
jgi:hypothetical protein